MPRPKPRRESVITRRVVLGLGAGVLGAAGLAATVWAVWLRPKAPPAAGFIRHLDQAKPASAVRRQLGVMAERRNVDARAPQDLKQALASLGS